MKFYCRQAIIILLVPSQSFFIQIITLRFRGNFHFSFSMSLLQTSRSFLCLQEALIFLTSLAVEWFPPAFDCQSSPKSNQRVTVFSFTFYSSLRPQKFGSCLKSSIDDDLPRVPGIMSLRHFLTFLSAIGYSHDSQHRWPGLSWNSPSLACVALLIHSQHAARPWSLILPPALASRHDLCSSFLPRLPQTSEHVCLCIDISPIYFSNYLVDISTQVSFCPLKPIWPELKSPDLFSFLIYVPTCLYKGCLFILVNRSIMVLVILAWIPALVSDFFYPLWLTYSLFLFIMFLASLPLLPVLPSWFSSPWPGWSEVLLSTYFTTTARLIPNFSSAIMSFFLSSFPKILVLFKPSTVWI